MDNHYVNTVTRQSGSNFYFSFFSLPKEKREAITAVYAFCREVDDVVDNPGEKNPAAVLAGWKEEIARTYEGKPTRELTRSLAQAVEGFDLSRAYFDGILQGVAMDLEQKRYPTYESLSAYCYHVAGEVGLLCMEIFGYRSERLKSYAVKLGAAFQLTNILRDVGTDADRGRIYIPQEDLHRFGVEESDVMAKRLTPNFRRLMAFEARRARDTYRESSVLPTPEERPSLRAAEIMRAIYENILTRIERRNYDVFTNRVRVPTPVKLWLAAKAWWECR
jgi:15-cis-phytoene synthase